MIQMARLTFGRLSEAWKGEAADFTPLLAEQLDQLGEAIGVDLAAAGEAEAPTAGGRRIDIVAKDTEGSEFVVENQYGKADHDHMTRGLAYAVARRARGLVIVAEEHRDEFRAVAEYLNGLGELDSQRGVLVWLVEAKAVRIGESPWAPLFDVVVSPNNFTAAVEQAKQGEDRPSLSELLASITSDELRQLVEEVVRTWEQRGYGRWVGPTRVVLTAPAPAASGARAVVSLYRDGRVGVPFGAYAGQNSGIKVVSLTTSEFRSHANSMFGFTGSEKHGQTVPGWLTAATVEPFLDFCDTVAKAYADALAGSREGETADGHIE